MSSTSRSQHIAFVITDIEFLITHRLDLLSRLSNSVKVTVITDKDNFNFLDNRINSILNKFEILHINKRAANSLLSFLRYTFQLRKILLKNKFSKVFFVTFELSIIGSMLKLFHAKTDFFFLITGFGPITSKTRPLLFTLTRLIFAISQKIKRSTFILQNYDAIQELLQIQSIQRSDIKIIQGNGIVKILANRHQYPKNCTFILAASLLKSKGIYEYYLACKKLYSRYQDSDTTPKFFLAGKYDPNHFDSIDSSLYEEIKNNSFLEYLGFLDQKNLHKKFQESSVFVLPSHAEGLPKSSLEAAINFLPLILTNIPGSKDCLIHNKTGLYISPGDTDDLVNAMEQFILLPEMVRAMGKLSREFVLEKFSIDKITEEYLSLIQ